MSAHLVHRRSACDRCRDQKLRCPRSDTPGAPCTRCHRAGAICFTSRSRPLGRPRIVYGQGAGLNLEDTSSMVSKEMATAAETPISLSSTTPASGLDDLGQYTTPMQSGNAEPWAHLDISTLFPLNNGLLGSFDAHCQTPLEESDGALRPEGFVAGMDVDTNGRSLDAVLGDQESNADQEGGSCNGSALSPEDIPIELSRLSQSIAWQLSKIMSYPLRSPHIEKHCSETANSVHGNPIAQALRTTAKFIAILRRLLPKEAYPPGHGHESPVPMSSSSPSGLGVSMNANPTIHLTPVSASNISDTCLRAPLSISNILLLLLNHLQLLKLWNTLMSESYKALCDIPTEVLESFQAPSNFHITGLPGIQGRLYAKLLIQIVEDQLSKVERLLTLPAEYRIYPKSIPLGVTDIFSDDTLSTLLHAAMTGADTIHTSTGKSLVASLRETLPKVVQALER